MQKVGAFFHINSIKSKLICELIKRTRFIQNFGAKEEVSSQASNEKIKV